MFIETFNRPGPKPARVFRRFGFLAWWLMLVGLLFSGSGRADQPGPNPVYVILWFDTEDYILAPSDDAAKRLADFLTAEGLHATFKVVGASNSIRPAHAVPLCQTSPSIPIGRTPRNSHHDEVLPA